MEQTILNSSTNFSVPLFESVVQMFYSGAGHEQENAERILTRFQNHVDSWQRVPKILEESTLPQANYLGLQILEKFIRTRWKSIPDAQRMGIRHFVVRMVTKLTSEEATMRNEKVLVNKLNLVLVQILKREWPHNWPTFIPELVQSSKANTNLCENNMAILKVLSEEIFDFPSDQLIGTKRDELKNSMCEEFLEIFQLCLEVLEKAQRISLNRITLETLLQFMNWIPLNYVFETSLIDMLLTRFLETPEFRTPTLKCLSEIASFDVGSEYDPRFVILFAMVMTTVNRMIPPTTDIAEAYEHSVNDTREFILSLALFLSNFLSNHLRILETPRSRDVLLNAHLYLIKISQVEEREIFKICLEYWTRLVAELYDEMHSILTEGEDSSRGSAVGPADGVSSQCMRQDLYVDVLSNLRLVVIENMVKPEEVLIIENEGEMVREHIKESETVVLYKSMRTVLVYLTHLDVHDTEDILTEKLLQQMNGTEWSWKSLNTLCWAIGSISGAMDEEHEKSFLVAVIKDLLRLCEMKQGKDNKAAVASNIMYIVGQYPRFLKAHYKFLKTVTNKLFDFMHESHQGVQDMACDTFLKISQKCKRQFIIQHLEEDEPFIEYILRCLHAITVDLSSEQVLTIYEAIGHMISSETNRSAQERLIVRLMEPSNNAWDNLIAQAGDVDILANSDSLMAIINILKTNIAACTSIGSHYLSQLGRIYLDMLGLYRACSNIINQAFPQGLSTANAPKYRYLRMIRKEILKLMDVYIKKADDLLAVNENLVPPLLESILEDYVNSSSTREAEVLNLMSTLVISLKDHFLLQNTMFMDSVVETAANIIDKEFTEFPDHDHLAGFYKLLRVVNLHNFNALLSIQPEQLKLLIESLVWGMKHISRDVSDLALIICYEVVGNFSNQEFIGAQDFYSKFLLPILQGTFWVIMDTDHKSGFRLQTQLLAKILELVETGSVSVPLFDTATIPNPNIANPDFLTDYCRNILQNAFPLLETTEIKTFLVTLFRYYNDLPRFRLALRDFLVQLKEFTGDNTDLYLGEKEKEAQGLARRIPGMVEPSQLENLVKTVPPQEHEVF